MRTATLLAALGLLLPQAAAAQTTAVLTTPGSDPAGAAWLADLLAEAAAEERNAEVVAGDRRVLADCKGPIAECMGLVATRAHADVVLLGELSRGAADFHVRLDRYTRAAGTVETLDETILANDDGLALALRSRVARFLTGKARAGKAGSMLVSSQPPGALLTMDGELIGIAPRVIDDLYPGPHLVEARGPGHRPGSATVMIRADTLTAVDIMMEPGVDVLAEPGASTIAAAAIAIVLAGAGAAFGMATKANQEDLDALRPNADTVARMNQLREDGDSMALMANLLFGTAGVALLGASYLYWDDWASANEAAESDLPPVPLTASPAAAGP
jgi:hypothetical protein